jgi:superoxide reductase
MLTVSELAIHSKTVDLEYIVGDLPLQVNQRKGAEEMANVVFYKCEVCGNMVALIKDGGGTLVCCGQDMKKLEANTTDAATEKHVPVVVKEDGKIKVTVGSTIHPMIETHYIEWIALDTGDRLQIAYLKPGMEPKAEFGDAVAGTVYEYCNLHGLWKAEI